MDRILQGVSATLTQTFYVDATATNPTPDSATVTILRDDGTTLTSGNATDGAGAGEFTYTLTPAETADLDVLTVEWTASFGGQAQTLKSRVEIVGGFLFSLAQLKGMKTGGAATLGDTYTAAELAAARTYAEQVIESECRIAFVPRYGKVTVRQAQGGMLYLPVWAVRSIRSITVDGTAFTASELEDVEIHADRFLYSPSGFARSTLVTVAFEHGLDGPPADISEQALLEAKHHVIRGPLDERTVTGADGQFTVPIRGRFHSPATQAVCDAHKQPLPA